MYTYKNVSPYPFVVPMVGEVVAGGTLESETVIENSNFELVSDTVPAEIAVAPAAPVAAAPVAVQVPIQPIKEATV